jgi:hypothetical protein
VLSRAAAAWRARGALRRLAKRKPSPETWRCLARAPQALNASFAVGQKVVLAKAPAQRAAAAKPVVCSASMEDARRAVRTSPFASAFFAAPRRRPAWSRRCRRAPRMRGAGRAAARRDRG